MLFLALLTSLQPGYLLRVETKRSHSLITGMFARPSKEESPRDGVDGRPTFMTSGGRVPVKRPFGGSAVGSATVGSSQATVALEHALLRKFGGTPQENAIVKKELQAALASGPVTEDSMKALQLRLADVMLSAGSKRSADAAKTVLSATQTRSSIPQPSTSQVRAPVAQQTAPFVPPKSAAAPLAARRESDVDGASRHDTLRPVVHTVGSASTGGAASSAYFASNDGGGDDGGRRSPQLRRLRAQMLSDPEPEKVLGLVEQTQLKLEKEDEKARRRAQAAAWTAELKAAEAEKAERAKREAALEQYWKGVVESNVKDLDARTRQEKADHAEREREQKEIRDAQSRALAERHAHEAAKLQAQEKYELMLTKREAEMRRQEAAADLREKQERNKKQMAENAALREAHRVEREESRLAEQRAMAEYNAMVEQQERAHKEALAGVFARQDALVSMANTKQKQNEERALEEKMKTLRAFEDQKRAAAEEEARQKSARKQRQQEWSADLTQQVEAHAAKSAQQKAHEAALGEQLASEARAAKAEEAKRAQAALLSRNLYRQLLEEQIAAKKQLELLKKQREHHVVAEQLDALEGDDRMMAEIAKLLKDRSDKLERAKKAMDEQNAMLETFAAQSLAASGRRK